MKTPLTSARLKQHLTYNWWKYLLAAVLAVGLVDMLYTLTAYRSPREKTIGFYVYGLMDEPTLTEYMEHVRETEMSDMEEMKPILLLADDTYGPMQMMTYMAAGEGDVYLLGREEFLNYASSGSLIRLEDDAELISLFESAGVSLQNGWRRETETGETHLYGIPQDKLPGLGKYAYAKDGYLCLIITGKNPDNAKKFLRILCRDTITAPEPTEEPIPEPTQNEQP